MSERLNPEGLPVYPTADVAVTTPGLNGFVDVHGPQTPQMRAAEAATKEFLDALREADLGEQLTVEVTETSELDSRGGTRAMAGQSQISLTVPGPGDGFGQVLLYAAEDGSLSWHFPDDIPRSQVADRGSARRTYRIPRAVPPTGSAAGQRGALNAVGKKLLKVLVFRLVDRIGQEVGDYFVSRWEAQKRPYLLRTFTSANYRSPGASELGPADWERLATGPALLFLHGTGSQSHSGFRRLPADLMAQLQDHYEGRVFAFDHPTISVTPTQNATWLSEQLPSGLHLVVDAVSHSRGGLLGRVLAEQAAQTGLMERLSVRNLVMVGTPNAGTVLADTSNLKHLLDRMTSAIQFIPDNGVTDVLDIVLAVVKQLAVGALAGLDGLMSMNPSGTYLSSLNSGATSTGATYHAVASNYEPLGGAPLARVARDGLTDLVFGNQDNDLVVPTAGVYTVPGAPNFPIADPLLFGSADGVDHSSYWGQPRFAPALLDWLSCSTRVGV